MLTRLPAVAPDSPDATADDALAPYTAPRWCAEPSVSGRLGRRVAAAGEHHRSTTTIKRCRVRQQRPVDAGDVADVGPTPVLRAVIGLGVGLAIGALIALLMPRGGVRRR